MQGRIQHFSRGSESNAQPQIWWIMDRGIIQSALYEDRYLYYNFACLSVHKEHMHSKEAQLRLIKMCAHMLKSVLDNSGSRQGQKLLNQPVMKR